MGNAAVSRERSRIRTIFFDVGGTLVHPAFNLAEVLRQEARVLGVARPPASLARLPDLVAAGLAARARAGRPFTYPASASEAFWMGLYADALAEACPPELVDPIIRRVYARLASPTSYALYPDSLPALDALAARGYVLGIVSIWERWLAEGLADMGLGGRFAHVIVSGEVELEEPDPRIFGLAVEAAGCDPEETAYAGDDLVVDVQAASAFGMMGVLIQRPDRPCKDVWQERVPVIGSLAELAPLLGTVTC